MEDIIAMARAAQKDESLSDGALYGKLADALEASMKLNRLHNFLQDGPNTPPRWIRDEKTNELYEIQGDGSYKAAYRLTPVS